MLNARAGGEYYVQLLYAVAVYPTVLNVVVKAVVEVVCGEGNIAKRGNSGRKNRGWCCVLRYQNCMYMRDSAVLGSETYQCTRTPPPPSRPSWMKEFVEEKCSKRFSSSVSSTSTTMCLKGLNRDWSSGKRRTDKTWVILAC